MRKGRGGERGVTCKGSGCIYLRNALWDIQLSFDW